MKREKYEIFLIFLGGTEKLGSSTMPYVLRFTFHAQYGIILKRLSWVGDRVPRDRDEESPDSAGLDAG